MPSEGSTLLFAVTLDQRGVAIVSAASIFIGLSFNLNDSVYNVTRMTHKHSRRNRRWSRGE